LFNLRTVQTPKLIISGWTINHVDIFTNLIFPFTVKMLRWPLVPDFRRQSSKSDFCPGLILSPIPPTPRLIFQILIRLPDSSYNGDFLGFCQRLYSLADGTSAANVAVITLFCCRYKKTWL